MPKNLYGSISWGDDAPVFKKKVKKDSQKKALERARASLIERASQIWSAMDAEGGRPGLSKKANFLNAAKAMNGTIIKEENLAGIINGFITFIESRGYVVTRNRLSSGSTEMEYMIARTDSISVQQFNLFAYDATFAMRSIHSNDNLRKLVKSLGTCFKNEQDGSTMPSKYSMRYGFRICCCNDILFDWRSTKKYFGKRQAKRASNDMVHAKIQEACKILE